MPEADEKFSTIFNTWANRWAVIWAFREVAEAGFPQAASVLSVTNTQFVERLVADPESASIFLDRDEFVRQGRHIAMATEMTRRAIDNARASVDAASLVFAHALLDDMALDCLRVISIAAPSEWEPLIEKRQVSLEVAKRKGYEEILREKIEEAIVQLGRESLLIKVDRLLAFCRPEPGWSPMRGYEFDVKRLCRLDNERHEIIHRGALGKAFSDTDANLTYYNKTGMYFIGLLNRRLGVRIDPTHFSQQPTPQLERMSGGL